MKTHVPLAGIKALQACGAFFSYCIILKLVYHYSLYINEGIHVYGGIIMKTLIFVLCFLLSASTAIAQQTLNFAWDLPTANSNGTPLTDLDVCRLYVSDTSGAYNFGPGNEILEVPASTNAPTGTVTDTGSVFREDGTYYFVLTAVDVNGNESGPSDEVAATVSVAPGAPILRLVINKVDGEVFVSIHVAGSSGNEYVIQKTYDLGSESWEDITVVDESGVVNVSRLHTNNTVFFRAKSLNNPDTKSIYEDYSILHGGYSV